MTAGSDTVIATGGSAVYSRTAMLHLKRYGLVYYLSLPEKEIEKRLYNITSRGIAMRRGETIEEVFACRRALYEEYGDIKVECGGKSMEEIVAEITDCHRAAELRG